MVEECIWKQLVAMFGQEGRACCPQRTKSISNKHNNQTEVVIVTVDQRANEYTLSAFSISGNEMLFLEGKAG
jgi:hypothetical protein